jgi:uncharacterized protein (DUF2336 family)
MTTVTTILADLESALASRSEDQKNSTIVRVTDMFSARADEYSPEQVGVFDVVIGRLASGVGVQSRIVLSERLAALGKAPHGVVRQLALDEIVVARPVLTRSAMLSESDLIAVASTKGRDHMLAITERPNLTAPVTDFLVVKGDRVISHALAHNETARFSARGMGLLVTRAFADDALQVALGGREDIPPELMVNLANAGRDSARRRLMKRTAATSQPGRQDEIANSAAADSSVDRTAASAAMRELSAKGKLDESALAGFAQRAATDEAVCAISLMAQISLHAAEQAVLGADRDAALVIGKAMGWDWVTVKALVALRPPAERLPHMIERARENYQNLSTATAHRVLQFMRVKEQAATK